MRRVPRYEDFALGFTPEPRHPERFRVAIRQAPCPRPDGTFHLPVSVDGLEPLMAGLEAQIRVAPSQRHFANPDEPIAAIDPEEIGHTLFQNLFQGNVWESFTESRERVAHSESTGLRLRLVIDPETPEGMRLAALPWELLYRRATRDHLSRSLWTPVVRFLLTRETPRPTPFYGPLRVLLVSSNPDGSSPLDLDEEVTGLEKALSGHGLEVHHLADPSVRRRALPEAIRRIDPHVLHFMGHGTFDNRTGNGGLILGDKEEGPRVCTGQVLYQMVRTGPSLRFVCLNACQTARLPRRQGQDPFSGVAASLVMAGIPAVVAMQFPISDRSAITFGTALYRALAAGDPVDAAVTEGRMAVFEREPASWEWATPALYLSAADGRLFATRHTSSEPPERRAGEPGPYPMGQTKNIQVTDVGNSVVGDTITIGTIKSNSRGRSGSRGKR